MKHINPKGYDWQGQPKPTPVDIQLRVLGLTEGVLDELKKGRSRVLDVGCGKDAFLVRFLRGRGINAEGLDFRIQENAKENFLITYCMPKGIKMANEIIPRPDNYYDLVISHCMDDFYNPVYIPGSLKAREVEKFEKTFNDSPMAHLLRSEFAFIETMRVISCGGKGVIYPTPIFLPNMQATLKDRRCYLEQQSLDSETQEIVKGEYKTTYLWFEKPRKCGDSETRTIIHKKD